jgi:hypothetical protein
VYVRDDVIRQRMLFSGPSESGSRGKVQVLRLPTPRRPSHDVPRLPIVAEAVAQLLDISWRFGWCFSSTKLQQLLMSGIPFTPLFHRGLMLKYYSYNILDINSMIKPRVICLHMPLAFTP